MMDWLERSKTSPKTGESIDDVLIPNKTLKTMIREWQDEQNIRDSDPSVCRRGKSNRFSGGG
jgi:hypothetical protein